MKINFNQPFKNYNGNVILKDGQPQTMADVIAKSLFYAENLDAARKTTAYTLSQKIFQATGDVELTIEELSLIKETVADLNPGGYAQIVNLIEK